MDATDNYNRFLPVTVKEMQALGWERPDVVFFSGDAYIDHPTFGVAVIARVLEKLGLKVAVVPQPNWTDDLRDFKKFGVPNLFFAVSAGAMDSMVNHYTANKRLRSDDAYTPGNRAGYRPDYAVTVYSNILKKLYPQVPLIIGGIEASLRRFTHYDYWSDALMPSVLHTSKADLLVYGMGEQVIREIAIRLQKGIPFNQIKDVRQTAFITEDISFFAEKKHKILHSHSDCLANPDKFADNFRIIEEESNRITDNIIVQKIDDGFVIVNPPIEHTSDFELDEIYELPFTYLPHPKYKGKDRIPAYEMIQHSINIHRGCFGGCSFCTISAHQGKFILNRSEKSVLNELEKITQLPSFKGYISDIGGPSANMYMMAGKDLEMCKQCKRHSCIFPSICNNLNTNHNTLTSLYKVISKHPNVKKAFVGSGVRYDLLFDKKGTMTQDGKLYALQLIRHHVSGRLKVAPEHTSDNVLQWMRKPSFLLFRKFLQFFNDLNKKENLNQQLIPYFISAHPGCGITDMADLAVQTKDLNYKLEQVQDFTPTPMTLSAVIYYSGIDPYSKQKVFIAKTKLQRDEQRAFLFWYKPENKTHIIRTLNKYGLKKFISKLFSR